MASKLPATMPFGVCDSWAMQLLVVSGTKMDMASSGCRHVQCLGLCDTLAIHNTINGWAIGIPIL